MDLRTVTLMLAIGSYLFGLLLVFFKYHKPQPQTVPFWITAKFLQATGSLALYLGTDTFVQLWLLGNTLLLMGCAYEAWAILILSGRSVNPRLPLLISLGINCVVSTTVFLGPPYRSGLTFLLQSIFYLLPALFLLGQSNRKSALRLLLSGCYFVTGTVFLAAAVLCLAFPNYALGLSNHPIAGIIPVISFGIFLMSGFILLMLAKERSDLQVLQMQKNLQKSEIRFQRIVETAIEGILILDEDYVITFANPNMAKVLGYTVDELVGKSYLALLPDGATESHKYQEFFRNNKDGFVFECCLLRKDGQKHWFLVSAKAIFDDLGHFGGYVAMLTDINERKEMELLLAESNRRLEELSNKDSLTGIANRRCFDATLEQEYSRLRRSNSKLSIILLDVDHFKDYNGFYGHVLGDECLRRVGKVLTDCINRSVDLAARYGGEEFACILPDTDLQAAVKIAEKIRQQIYGLQIEHQKSSVSGYVTASFGVATVQYSPDCSLEDIIAIADKLLYKAKAAGRNRIEYGEFNGYKTANQICH